MLAYASKIIPHRFDPEQDKKVRVGTPDSVHAITTQEDGSTGVYRLSGVVWHEDSMGIALYGSEGTLTYDLVRDEIRGANGTIRNCKRFRFRASSAAVGRSKPISSRPSAANAP